MSSGSKRWEPHWAIELALGTLSGEDRDAALAVLARDPAARAEVTAARELLAELPARSGSAPPSALREQVMKATEPASKCLGGFARRAGLLFDRDEEETRVLLTTVPTLAWEPGPFEGLEVFHLQGGPRTGGADVGFVRMPPGLRFPRHEHPGHERQLVLLGSYTTDDGREYLPGDISDMPAGSEHSFVVGSEPTVIAIVIDAPIKLL